MVLLGTNFLDRCQPDEQIFVAVFAPLDSFGSICEVQVFCSVDGHALARCWQLGSQIPCGRECSGGFGFSIHAFSTKYVHFATRIFNSSHRGKTLSI